MIAKQPESGRLTFSSRLILPLAVALAHAGCGGSTPTTPGPQPYNEHEWIAVERVVSGVRGVVLAMPGNLRIDQGPGEALTLRGEMALLPAVSTQMAGGILTISFDGDFLQHPGRPPEFLLSAPALESAALDDSGAIECSGFTGARLELRATNSGDLDFQNLSAEDLQVTAPHGSASIRVSGHVASQNVELAGLAGYEARDLQSSEARVVLSGSGSATVRVQDRLTVVITGSGSLYYFGDPEVESTISGSGQVVRLGG